MSAEKPVTEHDLNEAERHAWITIIMHVSHGVRITQNGQSMEGRLVSIGDVLGRLDSRLNFQDKYLHIRLNEREEYRLLATSAIAMMVAGELEILD